MALLKFLAYETNYSELLVTVHQDFVGLRLDTNGYVLETIVEHVCPGNCRLFLCYAASTGQLEAPEYLAGRGMHSIEDLQYALLWSLNLGHELGSS